MREHGRSRLAWIALSSLCAPFVLGFGWWWFHCAPVTTVFVVRHAEKALSRSDDPPLNEAGRTRAAALLEVVRDDGVDTVFATEYLRTRQTVQPTATALGLPVLQVEATEVDALVERILADHRGETVLVCGHGNTVPRIIEGLGGGRIDPIAENEHDDFFVVVLHRWCEAKVLRLRYGDAPAERPTRRLGSATEIRAMRTNAAEAEERR